MKINNQYQPFKTACILLLCGLLGCSQPQQTAFQEHQGMLEAVLLNKQLYDEWKQLELEQIAQISSFEEKFRDGASSLLEELQSIRSDIETLIDLNRKELAEQLKKKYGEDYSYEDYWDDQEVVRQLFSAPNGVRQRLIDGLVAKFAHYNDLIQRINSYQFKLPALHDQSKNIVAFNPVMGEDNILEGTSAGTLEIYFHNLINGVTLTETNILKSVNISYYGAPNSGQYAIVIQPNQPVTPINSPHNSTIALCNLTPYDVKLKVNNKSISNSDNIVTYMAPTDKAGEHTLNIEAILGNYSTDKKRTFQTTYHYTVIEKE